MRRSLELAGVFFVAVLFLGMPTEGDVLIDDFEQDEWLPFTHFYLGSHASAGYSALVAHSGARSYHVGIHGWALRDYGSAYGYAFFPTQGAVLADLRFALLYESLEDSHPSARDSFAAGIEMELLDGRYHSLGTYRYVTAYQPGPHRGLCAPTLRDVVVNQAPTTGQWEEVARNPGMDFPTAPWSSAVYVKVAVGFLCASGLTGADYSLYFDDFSLQTGSGDSDGDGIRDLEEAARLYAVQISDTDVPLVIPSAGGVNVTLEGPQVFGMLTSGAVALDLVHPRTEDLAVSLVISNGTAESSHLLWDPGFHARRVAVVSPVPGRHVRGTVAVEGRASEDVPGGWWHLLVDGVPARILPRSPGESIAIPWSSDDATEGPHEIRLSVSESPTSLDGATSSAGVSVTVDRTPPDLRIRCPRPWSTVSGLLRIEADAADNDGLEAVDVSIDGIGYGTREHEPYVFPVETLDLSNGDHTIKVRASDLAGNVVSRSVRVFVHNRGATPKPSCHLACNLSRGTSVGNLPPVAADANPLQVTLASGDVLEISEGFQVPWTPHVTYRQGGVSLILDVSSDPSRAEVDGLVRASVDLSQFAQSHTWRILVRDYGSGSAGFAEQASVRFVTRTSPTLADTDGDGLRDADERLLPGMSPVIADMDNDGLSDGWEREPHAIDFWIDGKVVRRVVQTDPLDPDTDHDGLLDGEELFPAAGQRPTDPAAWDTDGDGLSDGTERTVWGTDPTSSDTDGDGLSDGFEVTPHAMTLVVNGVTETRSVVTSPLMADTDQDGLSDGDEWNGASLYGFQTDPSDPDTDHDGLSDGDEMAGTRGRPTNPLEADTDGDGLIDGLDLAPTESWSFVWTSVHEPGLVRFQQRFHVFDVHGMSAAIYTYNIADGSCVFLSDHTSDATRSSNESEGNVVSVLQKAFLDGGESNYTAAAVHYEGITGFGWSVFERGECSLTAARKYRFEYLQHEHLYDVDFVNILPVLVRDDAGAAYHHTTLELPLTPSATQTLNIQVAIDPIADRGGRTADGVVVSPAFQYSLHRTGDFLASPAFYENVALGTAIDDHAYRFTLRVPRELAVPGNGVVRDGRVDVTLVLTPVWLTADANGVRKAAMDSTTMRIGAVVTRVEESAERIIARLDTDLWGLAAALPSSASGMPTGYYSLSGYAVYVYHLGDTFDAQASASADALYLSASSEEELGSFQAGLTWTPQEAWVRSGRDAFGVTLGILKILRRGISLSGGLTSHMVLSAVATPPWTWQQFSYDRSYIVVTRLNPGDVWQPSYVVSQTGVNTVNVRVYGTEFPDYPLTSTRSFEWEIGNGEMLDSLDESRVVTGSRFFTLKTGLQGAAVGATIVIFGGQAVLAYAEGDVVKGTVYAAVGTASVFGIVRSDIVLGQSLFEGSVFRNGVAVRVGPVAALAAGGVLAAYELYLAGETFDSIRRLSHYEAASTAALDTMVGVIPLYGPAIALGWQLGIGVAAGMQTLLGVMPNTLALRIVSSPGSTVVFLFEYVFASEIPSAVAEEVLTSLLDSIAATMMFNNCMDPPIPTILVAP